VHRIKKLLGCGAASPLDKSFRGEWEDILELFGHYQNMVIGKSGNTVSCERGCAQCCCHWVEDVYCFEAMIIADYVRTHYADRIGSFVKSLRRDVAEIERLDLIVTGKLAEHAENIGTCEIDSVDLLLTSFYQLSRPCAFLDLNGDCLVYSVRPLTCRIYMSFSPRHFCHPDYINESDVRTYLLDLEENASELLDRLHLKYDRFGNDLGLRSLMVKCLGD
jgi:Fe-S-cluster containining protein